MLLRRHTPVRGTNFCAQLGRQLPILALAAAAFVHAPAFAQQAQQAQTSVSGIEEITVTARRTEENLQKVPIAVTAITSEKIADLTINNTQDLNKLAANLSFDAGSSNSRTFRPSIRGYSQTFGTGQDSVISYFAEVPSFNVSFYDLENIQVLKGPQGTLFGETAVGGVLLFGPAKPTNAFGGYAEVQLGSYNLFDAEGAVNVPIVDDKLMVRVAGKVRKRKGFVTGYYTNGASRDLENVDDMEWRASVVWRPTDNIEDYFVYAGNHKRSNGLQGTLFFVNTLFAPQATMNSIPAVTNPTGYLAYSGTPAPAGKTWATIINEAMAKTLAFGPYVKFENYDNSNEQKFTGFINQFSWDIIDAVTFKNITGVYWSQNKGGGTSADMFDAPALDLLGKFKIVDGKFAPDWTGGYPSRTFTNEAQLLGTLFDERLKWQTGYYIRKSGGRAWTNSLSTTIFFGSPPALTAAATCTTFTVPAPCVTLTKTFNQTEGVYGQATFAILDNLNVTAGYRKVWDNTKTLRTGGAVFRANLYGVSEPVQLNRQSPLAGSTVVPTVIPQATASTYNFAVDYQVTNDILVYGTRRKGYKGGGFNASVFAGTDKERFASESIIDNEIGIKADFQVGDIRARTNIAVFYDKYSDIQRANLFFDPVTNNSLSYTSNLANADIKGLEIEPTLLLTEWLELGGHFAVTVPKFKNWLENNTCQTQFWRPQCVVNGVFAPTTDIFIDHVKGVMTFTSRARPATATTPAVPAALLQTINFTPEKYSGVSKWNWSIQPKLILDKWLGGEQVSITANYRGRSNFAVVGNNDNVNSTIAGFTAAQLTKETLIGPWATPNLPGYSVADLRVDWKSVMGQPLDLAIAATNVTNKVFLTGNGNPLTTNGYVLAVWSEPRMVFMTARYKF